MDVPRGLSFCASMASVASTSAPRTCAWSHNLPAHRKQNLASRPSQPPRVTTPPALATSPSLRRITACARPPTRLIHGQPPLISTHQLHRKAKARKPIAPSSALATPAKPPTTQAWANTTTPAFDRLTAWRIGPAPAPRPDLQKPPKRAT